MLSNYRVHSLAGDAEHLRDLGNPNKVAGHILNLTVDD
jgi:hypothetical protein